MDGNAFFEDLQSFKPDSKTKSPLHFMFLLQRPSRNDLCNFMESTLPREAASCAATQELPKN
jgi:hypothetical protein